MAPIRLLRAAAVLLALLAPAAARALGAESMITNGGFEGPYEEVSIEVGPGTQITGRIAQGWTDNSSWAQVVVEYGEEGLGPHGGSTCQRIAVRSIASGAVQLTQGAVTLEEGKGYRARVFARSPDAVPLRLQIRQPGAPYTDYAGRTCRPGAEWTACEVTFTSPVDGPALFMLIPGDLGVVDVDDASLELTAPASAAAPREGNLLITGRMVGAIANGWAPSNAPPEAFRYVPPSAPQPDPCVIITGRDDDQVSLYSPPVVVNCGRVHTLSLDMRSEPPGVKVWLTVHDARYDNVGIHRALNVTGEWQRYTLAGELPFVEGGAFAVRICPLAKADLYVRNVQLVEGEGPAEFRPGAPVEVAVVPEAPSGLIFDDEAAAVKVIGAGEVPDGARLAVSVCDLYGGVTSVPAAALESGNGFERSMTIRLAPDGRRGMFRIEAQVLGRGGDALSNVGQGLVARVPRPRYPDRLMPESPFGVHILLDDPYTRLAQNLGFKWCRIHDASMITKWPTAEPEPGRFEFFDDQVQLARSRGLMVLGMLDGAPPWASGAPEGVGDYRRRYYVPRDLDAWRQYVRTVVGHYGGLIDHWEVWNEPWAGGFFRKMQDGQEVDGTAADYVPLLQAAYAAAKEANPGCVVLGIDSCPPEWTRDCLAAGAAGHFDVFSFHQYTQRMPGGERGPLASLLALHRSLLAEHGLGDVEVWDTEGGPETADATFYRDLDPLAVSDGRWEAVWHARYYLSAMAAGVRNFFFYTLHAYPRLGQHTWVRLEPGRYLQPWAVAQANLANLLQGTRLVRQVQTQEGLCCLIFEGDGRSVAALFSDAGPVPAGGLAGAEALDLYGNSTSLREIGRSPVYLTGESVERLLGQLPSR